jgi:hypothetical protein
MRVSLPGIPPPPVIDVRRESPAVQAATDVGAKKPATADGEPGARRR